MKKLLAAAAVLPFLLFYSQPISAVEQEDTLAEESIYYILLDRFVNGNFDNDKEIDIEDPNALHGGDLQGVISKLDDLKEMGFTAINISPLMENEKDGYHGFWVTDFTAIEPHSGTMETAAELVEEAHKRDMKVFMDFPVNHTSASHPWLTDQDKQGWYASEHDQQQEQAELLQSPWLEDLPQLDLQNKEVVAALSEAGEFWLKETGLDGYRIGIEPDTPASFVADFSETLHAEQQGFSLLADWKHADKEGMESFREAGIDLIIDYEQTKSLDQVFQAPGNELSNLSDRKESGNNGVALDSQMTTRFTKMAIELEENPVTRWKLGLTYLYLGPGTPVIYQGSEVAMGNEDDAPDHRTAQLNSGNDELSQYLERLSAIRQQFAPFTKGNMELVDSNGAMSLFKRTYEGETVYFAINNATATKAVTIDGIQAGKQLRGLLNDETVRADEEGHYKIGLDRETAEVYVVEDDKGINWLFVSFILAVLGAFVFAIVFLKKKQKSRP
ncbi:alpha-amylase [Sediminibacillus dalangtanensis]|uniref:Alpha-amylase n=1 Tax=Sediminibacillus dalangtanensis TaxID=2729421 RepID=A0ABX7VWG1_9BACI|nr:alpha-amylase family glycosyl hydrolase [Sediminibacillus dalangtanensis]QTM98667.1 alpha-amylase [Sediminibacillus dalangtanensis]